MAPHEKTLAGGSPATEVHDEDLCLRCGRCCCRKFLLGEHVYHTPFYCQHLDLDTRLCTVYERRFEVNPYCLPVGRAMERGIFPADCPYVAGRADYRAPVVSLDFFGLGELAREIAREIDVSDEEFDRVRRLCSKNYRDEGGDSAKDSR